MPVPGDKIIGFITRNQGVSVHRVDCQNMLDLQKRQPERVVDVQWTSTKGVFMVKIQVEALDRPHLLSDVTRVLSDHGVNIISGSISTGTDRVATSQFSFRDGRSAASQHPACGRTQDRRRVRRVSHHRC